MLLKSSCKLLAASHKPEAKRQASNLQLVTSSLQLPLCILSLEASHLQLKTNIALSCRAFKNVMLVFLS